MDRLRMALCSCPELVLLPVVLGLLVLMWWPP